MAASRNDQLDKEGAPGVPADAQGNPAIDPSENVKALSEAAHKRQDDLRESNEKLQDHKIEAADKFHTYARDAESRMQTWMREAESKRIDQLAQLRQVYETRIAEMLAVSVKSTSDLVSTQLVQIQATFNDRVSKLEQFRWESGGADKGSRENDSDRRGNIGMIVGVASLCATAVAMIVGAVIFVVVHAASAPAPAVSSVPPTVVSPAVVPVQPK